MDTAEREVKECSCIRIHTSCFASSAEWNGSTSVGQKGLSWVARIACKYVVAHTTEEGGVEGSRHCGALLPIKEGFTSHSHNPGHAFQANSKEGGSVAIWKEEG